MRHHCTTLFAAVTLAGCLPAQMAGSYSIDPAGPGFASFAQAVTALFVNGVAGPVEILVAPGSYTESVLVPPIAGASPTNTITFRPVAGPGTVQLQGNGGDIFALFGLPFAPCRSLILDGLDFMGAPGHAISGTNHVEHIEIRNCTFAAGHQSTALGEVLHGVIVSRNFGNEAGWHVHHNRITLSPYTTLRSYGIYVGNGGGWDIHHNAFDLNGAHSAICLEGNNLGEDHIYDNTFTGDLFATASPSHSDVAVIKSDAANMQNTIAHNTFAVTIPNNGCCIATAGFVSGGAPVQNFIFGNVIQVQGQGTGLVVEASGAAPQPFRADGNIYFCPGTDVARIGSGAASTAFATVVAWQLATGQDNSSFVADPLLFAPFGSPPDLRPTPTSPVMNAAVMTPSFVVDDFAGRLRDAQPDAGAYESTSFAIFGAGCAGTNGLVPGMGNSGIVALGSTNFAFELTQARPNAPAILIGGASRSLSPIGPLPLSLGGSCQLLVSPEAAINFITSAAGAATAPLPIPASPAFSGLDLFWQWAVIDPASSSALGATFSPAAALQL